MAEYRLYCLNEAGKFSKVHLIRADSDEDALKQACNWKLPVECELWRRNRMAAKLEPHKAVRAARPL